MKCSGGNHNVYVPKLLWMAIDDNVVSCRGIISDSASNVVCRLLHGNVLRADGILQSLWWVRRYHCRFGRCNHLVINTLVASDVNRKRVIAQRFHFVDGQVSVWLVR
jgi:hypothetical protein